MNTLKNASGDEFEVTYDPRYHDWRAEQISGLDKNHLRIPALLHERSKLRLVAELRQHWSNE